MDLKTRLRNKLNNVSETGILDQKDGMANADNSSVKLSLAERIRLKKQQQEQLADPHISTKQDLDHEDPANHMSLKQKLLLRKQQNESKNENHQKERESENAQSEQNTHQTKSQEQTNFNSSTKHTISSEQKETLISEKKYKESPNKQCEWFKLLASEISVQSAEGLTKKRKLKTHSDNFFNKRPRTDTNCNLKNDDPLYGIIYPFTNIKKRAIANFSKPSPDEIILIANQQAELNQNSLKNMTLTSNAAPKAASVTTAAKSNLRAISFIKDSYTPQPHLSLCILGHIDSGKSTLTGRLLLDTKAVTQQQISNLQKQSKELGKQSFWLAWIMDSDSEERERGITKKFGYARFQSEMGLQYTLLDAPGHSDFISSTIVAVQQASVCTIVVDCTIGGFEKSFDGQLKEHLLLASKFVSNLNDLIFVMNKMDAIAWDKERYLSIMNEIKKYMIIDLKIDEAIVSNLDFIPVSSIEGENVVKSIDAKSNSNSSWYKGLSFIEKLDQKNLEHLKIDFPELSEKYINQDNCLAIVLDNQEQNKNNGAKQKGKDCSLTVKIIDGYFTKNDKVIISPRLSSKGYTIDDIWLETKDITNKNVPFAVKNQFVTLKIKNCNVEMISIGDIISLSSEMDLVHCSHEFQLKLETFEMNRPLLPGSPIIIYMNNVEIPCMISSIKVLKEVIDGEIKTKKKLKHLTGNTSNATVNIEIQEINESIKSKELGFSQDDDIAEGKEISNEDGDDEIYKNVIPVFTAKENNQLSKVLLRKDGKTIAFGKVNKRLD